MKSLFRFCVEGECKGECTTFSEGRLDPNFATVRLDRQPAEGQPQTDSSSKRTALFVGDLEKLIKDLIKILRRNTLPVIADADADAGIFLNSH